MPDFQVALVFAFGVFSALGLFVKGVQVVSELFKISLDLLRSLIPFVLSHPID